ncbi:hypothetical protein F5146DRAFT_994358 [Armillaria mellea]|nr:hypothetical protein F5146DRAFT_994358 [Armillaria mellea]
MHRTVACAVHKTILIHSCTQQSDWARGASVSATAALHQAQMHILNVHIKKCEVRFQGAWRSNKGATANCWQVINCINREIEGLAHRTGAHFVGFMSCSDIHDTFQPTLMSDSPASLAFFKRVVGMSAEEILVKFEQFCCAQSLKQIMGESIHMNYVHYNTDIVARHHVRLDSWPMGIKFREPFQHQEYARFTTDYVIALRTTACKWVNMNKKEVKAHQNNLNRREASGEIIKRK